MGTLVPGMPYTDRNTPDNLARGVNRHNLIHRDSAQYNARDFGARGNGLHDDSPVLQDAIDAIADVGGGVLYVPYGTYKLKTSLVPKDNVSIVGSGWGTIFKPEGLASGFESIRTPESPNVDQHFQDFMIDGADQSGTYSATVKGFYSAYHKRCSWTRIYVANTMATGLGMDYFVESFITDCLVVNAGRLASTSDFGANGIGIGTGGFTGVDTPSLVISNCIVKNAKRFGIMVENQVGSYDSGYIIEGCYVENCQNGIVDAGCVGILISNCIVKGATLAGIGPITGTNLKQPGYDGRITTCLVENCTTSGIYIEQNTSSGGMYMVDNCVSRNNTTAGIRFQNKSSGSLDHIRITNNYCYNNGQQGIWGSNISNGAIDGLTIEGNQCYNNGQNAGTTNSQGIAIDGTHVFNKLSVRRNKCYDTQGTGTQTYGIQLSSTITGADVSITDNQLSGNITGQLSIGTGFTTSVIERNQGYNPIGPISRSVGASPWTYTAGNTKETLYLIGGTVSLVAKNSVNLFTATNCSVSLEAGQSVTVTYSSAPTAIADRL